MEISLELSTDFKYSLYGDGVARQRSRVTVTMTMTVTAGAQLTANILISRYRKIITLNETINHPNQQNNT